jgi:uncharacterized protein YybS (DUF2232 family)
VRHRGGEDVFGGHIQGDHVQGLRRRKRVRWSVRRVYNVSKSNNQNSRRRILSYKVYIFHIYLFTRISIHITFSACLHLFIIFFAYRNFFTYLHIFHKFLNGCIYLFTFSHIIHFTYLSIFRIFHISQSFT